MCGEWFFDDDDMHAFIGIFCLQYHCHCEVCFLLVISIDCMESMWWFLLYHNDFIIWPVLAKLNLLRGSQNNESEPSIDFAVVTSIPVEAPSPSPYVLSPLMEVSCFRLKHKMHQRKWYFQKTISLNIVCVCCVQSTQFRWQQFHWY